eukprot:NODE_1489_length_889_cov_230.688095_g1151_i0.p1 GENE.NODE_1489_length_889_cov_230.688095_g1151_i0~~NODE_1489_length_889_cov_230.688095_g1151_i0.p1  ORF type:complete len:244 (+),score=45.00 NODE_1489_length_889_cov_230.688095_g1151_i0:59-733(+)
MAAGGGVVGLKYDGGVLIASDTLLSYGGTARWPNVQRIKTIGKSTAIAASGDYADFQFLSGRLDDLLMAESLEADSFEMGPKEIFSWLSHVMYTRRSKFEPLMTSLVVAGFRNGEALLGLIDPRGTHVTSEKCVATGMASAVALPLLRKVVEDQPNMTRDQAINALEKAMAIVWLRDCRSLNRFQIVDCSADGVIVSEPKSMTTEWEHTRFAFEFTKLQEVPGY